MIGGWPRTRWLSPTQMRVPPVPRSWGPVMTIRRWEPGDRRDVPQNLSEKPLRFKNEARPAVPPGPALRGALLFEEPEAALLPLPVHGQTPRSPAGARCGGRPRSHEDSYQAEGAPGPSAGGPGLTRNLIKLRVPPVPRFWGPGRKSRAAGSASTRATGGWPRSHEESYQAEGAPGPSLLGTGEEVSFTPRADS